MTDLFREIDEEVQKDKALAWWKKNSKFVYGLAVVIVLGSAGYKGWEAYETNRRAENSEAYAAALQQLTDGNLAAGQTALSELADPSAGGYGVLATFEQARMSLEEGDLAGATALWDQIAAAPEAGTAFQGVATLLSVLHQLDGGDPADLQARLDPLTEASSPFRPSALELSALLALRDGDEAKALSLYTDVADDFNAPPALRTRAAQMIDALQE